MLDNFSDRPVLVLLKYLYYNISSFIFLLDIKTSCNIYVNILQLNTYKCIITFMSNKYAKLVNKNIDVRERP